MQRSGFWQRCCSYTEVHHLRTSVCAFFVPLAACLAIFMAQESSMIDVVLTPLTIEIALTILVAGIATLVFPARTNSSGQTVGAADAVREGAEEHSIFFESSRNLILVMDETERILRVTPSVAHILGFAINEVTGRCLADYISTDDCTRVRDELRLLHRDISTGTFDAHCYHKHGQRVALSWSCTWSKAAGRYFCIGRDRTEINQQQEIIIAQNSKLDLALANMSQGLLMFERNSTISLVNAKFVEMFGLDVKSRYSSRLASDVLRDMIVAGSIDATSRLAEHLHAIADQKFEGDISDQQELTVGQTINYKFTKLTEGGVLATFEDITQLQVAHKILALNNSVLKQREADLQTKNLQLDAAINNMNHGLTLLDSECRLVLINDLTLQMYDLTRSEVTTGMPLADALALRVAKGVTTQELSDKAFAVISDRLRSADYSVSVVEMANGNQLSISCIPMTNGGWVITHRDVTKERQREAQILHMSRHDILTNLSNRSVLTEALDQSLAHCRRGKMAALHFLDLDYFKTVNDTLGHAIGDKLLLAVSVRLTNSLRQSDVVARLGGDEFAILQSFIECPEDAISLATRLIDTLRAPYEIDGRPITIGVSIGIALAPADGLTAETLLKNADLALYRAKELGRGDYHFFEPALDVKMLKRRDLEDELRKALKEGEFELHYQPLVSTDSKKIHGVEALLRWRHPKRGMISPLDFIPVAEEIGLISPIGDWVIREACAMAATLPSDIRIAINLSPVQFRRPGIVRTIIDALATTQLDATRLEFEITESLLLEASDAVLEILHQLRGLGAGIALDDFGTGYSSLSYLQKFPFTRIKIDRSFVKNLGVQVSAAEIIKAIVAIARAVDMKITAEGIETEQQLALAIACGCTEFQGYHFSRPLPGSEFATLLSEKIDPLKFAA